MAVLHHITVTDPSQILRQCNFTIAAWFSSVLFVDSIYPFHSKQLYAIKKIIFQLEVGQSSGFGTLF